MNKKQYTKTICRFYSEIKNVWPDDDKWHIYTHNYINDYVMDKINSLCGADDSILNAGSGGNTYGLKHNMYHLDITENKINGFPHYKTGSVDNIPYKSNMFDACICVGTVINYCDARKTIKEFSRVLKQGGTLVLEFENSLNPEFNRFNEISKGKKFITSEYFGHDHQYWVYSENKINNLLSEYGFVIKDKQYFHIISSFVYSHTYNENFSSLFTVFDKPCSHIQHLRRRCANIIVTAVMEKKYEK